MEWPQLASSEDVDKAIQTSHERPQVVLKHSTRCGVSSMAKGRLERSMPEVDLQNVDYHLVDVVGNRPVSDYLAKAVNVHHESPQLLVLQNGECVLDATHFDIDLREVADVLQ